jgi:hypothetical protein
MAFIKLNPGKTAFLPPDWILLKFVKEAPAQKHLRLPSQNNYRNTGISTQLVQLCS